MSNPYHRNHAPMEHAIWERLATFGWDMDDAVNLIDEVVIAARDTHVGEYRNRYDSGYSAGYKQGILDGAIEEREAAAKRRNVPKKKNRDRPEPGK